ncbi:hypothetical protein THRCLA_03311 [Thraustotheca clavata]|uniref:Transmembrane protein n=1 Tax=Thraustotheca clavata TaxID=74557 RepID=A0A1W0A2G6_9STRA|nr:hypothetical protein THRCLA_03311 [Thraustotheca clavata]
MLTEEQGDIILVSTPHGYNRVEATPHDIPTIPAPDQNEQNEQNNTTRRAANYIEDPTELILKACAPPVGRTLHETLRLTKAKNYAVHQFGLIQARVGMNPRTLQFDHEFEPGYLHFAQVTSVIRIRITFFVAMVFLALLLAYEANQNLFRHRAGIPLNVTVGDLSENSTLALYILSFGISIPALFIGFILTFSRSMYQHIEKITFTVFFIVAMTLIVKKPFQEQSGPVLSLMILLIPLFGITRMRFVHSAVLGWTIFFIYLIVQMVSLSWINNISYGNGKTWKYDGISDVIYQTVNYGVAVIGGMVSHYRQELIRRRNYALKLPFTGLNDEEPLDFFGESYSEERLLDRWNLSFRNLDVEEYFCRIWYVIDPQPYENPNRGDIHENVYMTIRFAIFSVGLAQVVMGIQDIKLLFMKDFTFDYTMATIIRFGVICPLYLSSFYFMYILGKKYYQVFLRRSGPDPTSFDESSITIDVNESRTIEKSQSVREKFESKKERWVETKGGYVRSAQIYSTIVIALQTGAMMALLLQVGHSYIYSRSTKQPSATKPNVYFMGFLNAILFAHRSGFKLRYVYASRVTWAMVYLFIFFASHNLHFDPWEYLWAEYTCYLIVVQCLGLMISHEEESLRRSFFVLRSMRMLEFEKWFSGVLLIQKGVRKFLARKKSRNIPREVVPAPPKAKVMHAQAFLAMASKMGCQAQVVQIVMVLFDLIYAALK